MSNSLEGIWQPVYAELDGESSTVEAPPIPACHRSDRG